METATEQQAEVLGRYVVEMRRSSGEALVVFVSTGVLQLFNTHVRHLLLLQVPIHALPNTWNGTLLMVEHMAGFVSACPHES